MTPLKSKEDIVWDAVFAAKDAMQRHAATGGLSYSLPGNSMMGMLIDMIAKAVEESTRATLRNLYTNEEFERDLGLK